MHELLRGLPAAKYYVITVMRMRMCVAGSSGPDFMRQVFDFCTSCLVWGFTQRAVIMEQVIFPAAVCAASVGLSLLFYSLGCEAGWVEMFQANGS